ncbi:MAG: hypothetical protein CVU43_04575 [Chloroflexi bacterium HGW-Chloroflexi-5]|nr:MAG: hypothetical protein CVU43_04575 [Chloroflexi bacterium HGW-Chloroflexi-5]
MKERPILFSGEMVRAILEGRKTQTRRVIKPQPSWRYPGNYERSYTMSFIRGVWCATVGFGMAQEGYRFFNCPYEKGMMLWVREAYLPDPPADGTWDDVVYMGCKNAPLSMIPEKFRNQSHCLYKSTWKGLDLIWKPSIHMPRWASRILLEVVSVRVERVQDISLKDINAEGTPYTLDPAKRPYGTRHEQFQRLWDSINEKRGLPWESNPWVWVIEFKKVEG